MKHKPAETPWGPSESEREFAPGIVFHSTASHGGYHLSTERWKDFTSIAPFSSWPAPWLEEDCDAHLVYLRWPELATDEQIHDAVCMARAVASWKDNSEGRWALLVGWIEQRPELLARAQAHAEAVKQLWSRGSMSTTKKPGIWCVLFRRGDERREVHMDYPAKRYYSDSELDLIAGNLRGDSGTSAVKTDPATDKFFNDRHDARVAAGNRPLGE